MDKSHKGKSFVPGAVGPFADNIPPVHQANIRPYAIAILLHKHEISLAELVGAIQPFCPSSDYKVCGGFCYDPDLTRLECLCLEVLDEMWTNGILSYNEGSKIWSLVGGPAVNLSTYINWASATGGMISRETLDLF